MPKRRKRKKKIPYPVDRGRQLYRAILMLGELKRGPRSLGDLVKFMPEWSGRTLLRDLLVLEALGWIKRDATIGGRSLWSFVGITEVQADGIALVSDGCR